MQGEIDAGKQGFPIQILGVNGRDYAGSNSLATSGVDLPWLQDTASDSVWASWGIQWRDLVILDAGNRPVAVLNLFDHNLNDPANYDSLKTLLGSLAEATGG